MLFESVVKMWRIYAHVLIPSICNETKHIYNTSSRINFYVIVVYNQKKRHPHSVIQHRDIDGVVKRIEPKAEVTRPYARRDIDES